MDALEVSSTRRCGSGQRCNRAELLIVQTCHFDGMMADAAGWPAVGRQVISRQTPWSELIAWECGSEAAV